MPGRKYEKKLHIDMPFDEALERFAKTDPKEVKALASKKKKTAAKKLAAADDPKSPADRKRQS